MSQPVDFRPTAAASAESDASRPKSPNFLLEVLSVSEESFPFVVPVGVRRSTSRLFSSWTIGQSAAYWTSHSYTASFSSLAARNAILLLALILMASPVAGFRRIRAARFRTWRMRRPVRPTLLPFFKWPVVSSPNRPARPQPASLRCHGCGRRSSEVLECDGVDGRAAVALTPGGTRPTSCKVLALAPWPTIREFDWFSMR